MATTASGYPYVQPADRPLEFPASSQALATLLDTRLPDSHRLRAKTIAGKTTDASGVVQLTAADVGLTSVLGACADVLWSAAIDSNSATLCAARVATNAAIQVRIFLMNPPATGGTLKVAPSGLAVTLHVIAWGA